MFDSVVQIFHIFIILFSCSTVKECYEPSVIMTMSTSFFILSVFTSCSLKFCIKCIGIYDCHVFLVIYLLVFVKNYSVSGNASSLEIHSFVITIAFSASLWLVFAMVYLFLSSYFQPICVFWFKVHLLCTADSRILLLKSSLTISAF